MRRSFLFSLVLLSACSGEANHLGNPLLWPVSGILNAAENAAYNQRRGQVELLVKSSWPEILEDIRAGGGPVLWQAMEIARIPVQDRPARVTQLQGDLGLYENNPGSLVVALMVYGS